VAWRVAAWHAAASFPPPVAESSKIALVGEARGEFLFLRMAAERLRERFGAGSVMQIELDPADLSEDERATTLVPQTEPEFRAALGLPAEDLPRCLAEAEKRFEIPNLRRLWRGDILRWREGVSDDELARHTLGYLDVFDRLYRETPELAGGFAEESARLIKRAFRAVSRHHGRRMLIAIALPMPDRVVLVDQENLREYLPPYEDFDPTREQLAAARDYAEQVRRAAVTFARPRDFSLTRRRFANFARLAAKAALRSEPGARNAKLRFFTKDYLLQRARVATMDRLADREPAAGPAVFYPLHFAEDSSVTIRAEPYYNQFALMEYLAACLPYGYELWVKPHPAAAGDLPVSRLLALQRRIPNLHLLHPSVPAVNVLRQVAGVVTLNSTTGFEALVLGKPVITLADSPYRGFGVTYDVRDPATLPTVLAEALRAPGPDQADVGRLIAYYIEIGLNLTTMGFDLSRANAERYADALAQAFSLGEPVPAG
jgi:hypothetical protein